MEVVWPFFSLDNLNYFFSSSTSEDVAKNVPFESFLTLHGRVFSNDGLFQPLFFVITQLGKNEGNLWNSLGIPSWLLDIGLFVCATLLVQNLARGLQGFVNKNTFRPAEKNTAE